MKEDEAKAVIAQLKAGADFATLAREKSIDPKLLLGQMQNEKYDSFWDNLCNQTKFEYAPGYSPLNHIYLS